MKNYPAEPLGRIYCNFAMQTLAALITKTCATYVEIITYFSFGFKRSLRINHPNKNRLGIRTLLS